MSIKLLTTTFVSMSLLSLNLFASGQMGCTSGFCMVKIQKPSPKSSTTEVAMTEVKKESKWKNMTLQKSIDTQEYETVVMDNIETIIFPHSTYVMNEDEVVEYDLEQMQKNLTTPALNSDLPLSDFLCEDNLKPIKVAGIENTYECS